MPWVNHKLLQQHDLIPKALHGLPLSAVQLGVKVLGSQADPHALPTAPSDSFDHHWVTNLLGFGAEKLNLGKYF